MRYISYRSAYMKPLRGYITLMSPKRFTERPVILFYPCMRCYVKSRAFFVQRLTGRQPLKTNFHLQLRCFNFYLANNNLILIIISNSRSWVIKTPSKYTKRWFLGQLLIFIMQHFGNFTLSPCV